MLQCPHQLIAGHVLKIGSWCQILNTLSYSLPVVIDGVQHRQISQQLLYVVDASPIEACMPGTPVWPSASVCQSQVSPKLAKRLYVNDMSSGGSQCHALQLVPRKNSTNARFSITFVNTCAFFKMIRSSQSRTMQVFLWFISLLLHVPGVLGKVYCESGLQVYNNVVACT